MTKEIKPHKGGRTERFGLRIQARLLVWLRSNAKDEGKSASDVVTELLEEKKKKLEKNKKK